MVKVVTELRGKKSEWGAVFDASPEMIADLKEAGHEIGFLENSMPAWVCDIGLARVWCFFQDIWNFKNPFRS